MKDHEIAQLVNQLTAIAKTYGQMQQIRERIAHLIVPILKERCKQSEYFNEETTMKDYQSRVINEKIELDKKAYALSQFIGLSPIFETLDIDEQERLKEQCEVMWEYSEILGKRIKAFTS